MQSLRLLLATAFFLTPLTLRAQEPQEATAAPQEQPTTQKATVESASGEAKEGSNSKPVYLFPWELNNDPNGGNAVARFGWWGVTTSGSTIKTGEWQDLKSYPFWDLDGLWTNGNRTVDFFFSGFDPETSQLGTRMFGPVVDFDFFFQRYPHHLDHDPLYNFLGIFEQAPQYTPAGVQTAPGSRNRAFVSQDLNVGEDYAIRVQELEGQVGGNLTEDLKFRVKVWGLRKFGERQTNGAAHCFNGPLAQPGVPAVNPFAVTNRGARSCHVLSGGQSIDWLTQEITPALEWRWGSMTLAYSHTVRSFSQNDELLARFYNSGTATSDGLRAMGFNVPPNPIEGKLGDYSAVPENLTHYGQIHFRWEMTSHRDLYATTIAGNTHDQQRDTDRNFYGFDIRLIDRSLPRLDSTAYVKMYGENNELPPFRRWDEIGPPPPGIPPGLITDAETVAAARAPFWQGTNGEGFIRHPWDYVRTTAGLKSRWRPLENYQWVSWINGYEYTNWHRYNATFDAIVPTTIPTDPDRTTVQDYNFGTTVYNSVYSKVQCQWSSCFDSYAAYTRRWIHNPLYAVHEPNGTTNTSLPTGEDVPELGSSWHPNPYFTWSGTCWLDFRTHYDDIADFDENNYNLNSTVWCMPRPDWSVTLSYSYFGNWIDQDITFGDQIGGFSGNQSAPNARGRIFLTPITTDINYGGQAHVVSLGTSHKMRPKIVLSGGLDYVFGLDEFAGPAQWPDLGEFSRVDVQTLRLRAGIDWFTFRIPSYFRYILFDYFDKYAPYNTGVAHMFLAGCSHVW